MCSFGREGRKAEATPTGRRLNPRDAECNSFSGGASKVAPRRKSFILHEAFGLFVQPPDFLFKPDFSGKANLTVGRPLLGNLRA